MLRGLSVRILEYFLEIERNSQLLKVGRFRFGNANMGEIYERSLSTIIAQGKFRDSFDPRSQTRSREESTWKGDRLEITRVVDCFFFYYYTFDLLWLFYIRCFVLSSHPKKQTFDTIGILLHYILGEFYRRMPCLLSTVFVTYFLEIRDEA